MDLEVSVGVTFGGESIVVERSVGEDFRVLVMFYFFTWVVVHRCACFVTIHLRFMHVFMF